MLYDFFYFGFFVGQIGCFIIILIILVIVGDFFEMDVVGVFCFFLLCCGFVIDFIVDIFIFYVFYCYVYGEQWIKFMKDGVNVIFFLIVNIIGYIDYVVFFGMINFDINKIFKYLFQGYLNIYNNYFKVLWMFDCIEVNFNEFN